MRAIGGIQVWSLTLLTAFNYIQMKNKTQANTKKRIIKLKQKINQETST